MIRPINAEELRRRVQASPNFPHFVIDGFLEEEFARQVHDAYPQYDEALRVGRSFRTVNERKKVQVTDASLFAPPIQELNRLLAEPAWTDLLRHAFDLPPLLCDEELHGGGMHQTGSRGRLDVHVDFNYLPQRQWHRRLNAIVYLNPHWPPAWGGQLELWDADVKHCLQTLEPVFNRCVVFATTDISYHGVTAVTCPDDQTRKSFATYYYTTEPPPHWVAPHDSVFHHRPDELMNGYVLMPAETLARRVREKLWQWRWDLNRVLWNVRSKF